MLTIEKVVLSKISLSFDDSDVFAEFEITFLFKEIDFSYDYSIVICDGNLFSKGDENFAESGLDYDAINYFEDMFDEIFEENIGFILTKIKEELKKSNVGVPDSTIEMINQIIEEHENGEDED